MKYVTNFENDPNFDFLKAYFLVWEWKIVDKINSKIIMINENEQEDIR